jgi:hypothetical protein
MTVSGAPHVKTTLRRAIMTNLTMEEFSAQWTASLVPKDIKGAELYHLKALTMFEHGRGVAWKASIYAHRTRIGEVSNEGVGGCNFYVFNTPELRDAFEGYVRDNYPDTVYDRDDHFIEYLIDRDGLG